MKAISPVIATVIIVAVAIAISIAVALWITGLTSSFTGVEKLEIVNAYAEAKTGVNATGTPNHTLTYWVVHVIIKNTGTKTATIDQIFINNKPGDITKANYTKDDITWKTIESTGLSVNPGETVKIMFNLTSEFNSVGKVFDNETGKEIFPIVTDTFSSGQTVSIVIHTASGGQYPATITLP